MRAAPDTYFKGVIRLLWVNSTMHASQEDFLAWPLYMYSDFMWALALSHWFLPLGFFLENIEVLNNE